MRVLHVISGLDPENGGPTTALIGMAEAQAAVGLQVSVIATWQRTSGFPNAERLKSKGIHVTLVGQAYGKLSKHPDLRRQIQTAIASADIVHVHAIWEQIQHEAMRAATKQQVPFVVTPHGMLSRWSFTKNRLAKTLYFHWAVRPGLRHASAIHYTAQAESQLAARFKLPPPTLIEPCGIDLLEFDSPARPGRFRERYPQIGSRPLILFLGRLTPQKGLDLLIPAFIQFARRDASHAMLALAGPDENGYQKYLESVVREAAGVRELEERIIFTGMLNGPDRIDALRDADLFVLPSRHENFGIVAAEALAAGTPVLVSRGVNIWREIESAGVGSAVDVSFEPIYNGLSHWMSDEPARRAAAAKSQAFAQENYDWRKIAARWKEHYERLR